MFRIGEFSKIAQVPGSLLRYYDQIGLLKPAHIDQWTGYRYYSAKQLPRLHRILALKELGLTLEQITRLVEEEVSAAEIRGMLILKKAQVEHTVQEEMTRLRSLEARLQLIADRALPPSQAKTELRDQGFLGILNSFRRPLPGTKKWGVEVKELHINGPAKRSGLRPGDVITEFNGHSVKTPNEFNRHIRAVKPGSKVAVTFYRGVTEQKIEMIMGHRSKEIERIMRRRR